MMKTPLNKKATVRAIRERFDGDVDRFSNLETGQKAVVDAPLMMELISKLSVRVVPRAENLLDIGCGAGNNTIRILRERANLNCDLVDLSRPMLQRAEERLRRENAARVRTFQGDFRTLDLPAGHYDIIVAAAVLHHLRDEQDWLNGFAKIYRLLRPSGALFVSDIIFHQNEAVHHVMWERYGEYLSSVGGPQYREHVFDYVDKEDSPRDLTFQIALMWQVGFKKIDILHKHSCFGAYVAIK